MAVRVGLLGPCRRRSPLCSALLRFIRAEEVGVAERGDDILIVVEDFVEHAIMSAHVEKQDDILICAAAFAMDIARRAGLCTCQLDEPPLACRRVHKADVRPARSDRRASTTTR